MLLDRETPFLTNIRINGADIQGQTGPLTLSRLSNLRPQGGHRRLGMGSNHNNHLQKQNAYSLVGHPPTG